MPACSVWRLCAGEGRIVPVLHASGVNRGSPTWTAPFHHARPVTANCCSPESDDATLEMLSAAEGFLDALEGHPAPGRLSPAYLRGWHNGRSYRLRMARRMSDD